MWSSYVAAVGYAVIAVGIVMFGWPVPAPGRASLRSTAETVRTLSAAGTVALGAGLVTLVRLHPPGGAVMAGVVVLLFLGSSAVLHVQAARLRAVE